MHYSIDGVTNTKTSKTTTNTANTTSWWCSTYATKTSER
jgi:hypothetical protein